MPLIRHIVLINWKENVPAEQINSWITYCDRIPRECPMVHNWSSGYCVTGPDPDKPSTHEFGITFDLHSKDEWEEYLKHPYQESVYIEGVKIIDLNRTASANMLVKTNSGR